MKVSSTKSVKSAVVKVLPNLPVRTAMVRADKLRTSASNYNEQIVVAGRKALLALMSDIYGLYFEARQSADEGAAFLGELKAKLVHVQIRKSATLAALLVRYVCVDFDDKQVSIYGRSLPAAYKAGVQPAGYVAFIENTEGGFAGLQAPGRCAPKAPTANTTAGVALVEIRAEKTVETLVVNDWGDEEEFRVLIALRNDDDTADLKNANLLDKGLSAVLTQYKADKSSRAKPAKDEAAEADKLALKAMKGELANAETEVANLQAELNLAVTQADLIRAATLRASLKVAELKLSSFKSVCKSLQASLSTPAVASLLS